MAAAMFYLDRLPSAIPSRQSPILPRGSLVASQPSRVVCCNSANLCLSPAHLAWKKVSGVGVFRKCKYQAWLGNSDIWSSLLQTSMLLRSHPFELPTLAVGVGSPNAWAFLGRTANRARRSESPYEECQGAAVLRLYATSAVTPGMTLGTAPRPVPFGEDSAQRDTRPEV